MGILLLSLQSYMSKWLMVLKNKMFSDPYHETLNNSTKRFVTKVATIPGDILCHVMGNLKSCFQEYANQNDSHIQDILYST